MESAHTVCGGNVTRLLKPSTNAERMKHLKE